MAELVGVTRIHAYDELGMLKKVEVHKGGTSILSNTLLYKNRSGTDTRYLTKNISKEIIKLNGNAFAVRSYTTDALGRVTKINDSVFGTHTYEYDYRGFLVKEDNTTYTYDKNGNIKSRGSIEYKYESSIRDRLTEYNGKKITYHTDNPGCIASYDGNTYLYEGCRLVSVNTKDGKTIQYTYDDKGLRIKKEIKKNSNTTITNYVYEGDKLIAENSSQGLINYLYDENNQLYGFVFQDNRYYYIRDSLQNILGIIDDNGTLVVKYSYSAYGMKGSITGPMATTIGNLNPFRYKGYYYDVETGLFWLSSRYYSPELCRFISPDSVDYLDPSSINGLNLYAYCMNDPINYADPSGHWVETVFDLFSLGVSIVEVIINPYDPLNWAGLAGDALDLIPFVTGVGETVRGVKVAAKGVDMADDVYDTIKIMKVADLTDDAWDTIRGLDRAGDFTQSTMSAGRKIHKGYKFDLPGKEYGKIPGIRMDYFDKAGKLVYELKPYNVKSLKAGVSQLSRYRRTMGKGYTWILELY